MSLMKDTTLRSAEQLGLAIRVKRLEKRLSQTALAERLGVERKWVLRLEAGNPKAEVGLVLKALSTLGIVVALTDQRDPTDKRNAPPSRIEEVFHRLQKPTQK